MNKENKNLNNRTNEDKKNTMIGCCTVIVILIAIIAIIYGIHKHIVNVNQQKAIAMQEQQEKEEKEKQEQAQEEANKLQQEMPKINFTGKITPQIVKSGGKVVISVEIENTSEDTTINGIKLLFSNKNILDKGLVITNIMNGGVRDDRKVNWNIDIPPKEKRTFDIVANANEPGEYETAITFEQYNGSIFYKSLDGNDELDGKLVVTP